MKPGLTLAGVAMVATCAGFVMGRFSDRLLTSPAPDLNAQLIRDAVPSPHFAVESVEHLANDYRLVQVSYPIHDYILMTRDSVANPIGRNVLPLGRYLLTWEDTVFLLRDLEVEITFMQPVNQGVRTITPVLGSHAPDTPLIRITHFDDRTTFYRCTPKGAVEEKTPPS